MSSVDDRIVNMKFNNSQFGQGVDQSKRDLTGLEKTIANTAKGKGMTQLGSSVDGVKVKFSALQVAGTAALATIASKATLAAGSMLKKLTIQPLMDGFREYQTNLESIQTIMANTGKDVDTVNKYLGELNKYSDQTIYNFSQMAKNIGTFTAAGVELDTATSAIKGISNLAALSGSNSQQASTAMYQLSQAISAGKVGLMDWNSVVNAGMGGKVFKNALAQTAVAMGDLSAGAVKVGTDVEIMGTSFRNSISAAAGGESWLSSEVLVATLSQLDGRFSRARMAAEGFTTAKQQDNIIERERQKLQKQGIEYSDEEFDKMVEKADAAYAAATQIKTATQLFQVVQESIGSMWAGAFQIILGDFEQSKELWGNVGDVVLGIINKISGGFLGALRIWEERGGRMKVIDGLSNIFGGLVDIMGAVAKGFDAAFPDTKVSLLNRMSKAFFAFSEALVPSKDTLKDIGTIAEAVFSILHFGFTIVKGVAKGLSAFFGALFGATEGARGGILSVVASIAEVIIAVEDWLTSGSKITRFLKGLGTLAGTALSPIIAGIGLVIDAFASLISGEGLGGAADALGRAGDVFGNFFGGILQGLDQITAPFDGLKSDIADFAGKAAEPFQGLIDKLDAVRLKVISGLGLDTIAPSMDGLRTLMERVNDSLVNFAEKIRLPKISMDDLGNAADWVVDKFNAMVDAVTDAAQSLDISDKLNAAKDAIADLFSSFGGGASGAASSAASSGAAAMASTAESTSGAFSALGDVMSGIWGLFKTIAGGIGDAFSGMVGAISNIPFPDDALEWATVLNALISGALIKRLFFSKGVLGELKDTIAKLGDGIQESFGQLTDTLKTMQGAVKSEIIKNIAIAVALLVASLIALSFIPTEKLANGLGALAAVMGMAALMMKLMLKGMDDVNPKELTDKATAMLALGAAFVLMATAVAILSGAVIALAMVPWQKLAVGLAAVGILIGIMVVALQELSGNSAKIAAAGAAMVLMATAVNILVTAVIALGMIPFDVLAQGLAGVAAGIAIMTVSLEMMSKDPKGIAAAGLAMVLMATAINIMVASVTALGLLPWDVVARGLVFTAIGMGLMVAAIMVLADNSEGAVAGATAMVLLAGAMNLFMGVILGLGAAPWDVVARGLLAVAVGFGIILLAALAASATPILAGLTALTAIISAIGIAMLAAGAGFLMFATGLSLIVAVGVAAIGIMTLAIHAFIALLPTIAVQMVAAFVAFIQAIALAAPKLREAFGTIFKEMIGTVRDAIPEIGKLIQTLIDTGIGILENSIPQWIELGFTLIDSFLESMADHVPNIVDNAVTLITTFLEEVGSHASELGNAGLDLVVDIINGISDAVENSDRVRNAAWNLVRTFGDEIREAMGEVLGAINPMNYLPDISLGDLKGLLPGGGNGRMAANAGAPGPGGYDPNSRKGNKKEAPADLVKALADAGTVIANAVSLFTGAMSGPIYDLVLASKEFQKAATVAATVAEVRDTSATVSEEAASAQMDRAKGMKGEAKYKGKGSNKEGANKKGKAILAAKEAAKLAAKERQAANAAAKQAILAQQKADYEDAKARDAVTYKDDAAGLGASRAQAGSDLADSSQALAAQAKAREDEAARLEKVASNEKTSKAQAKKYREEAKRLRKEAAAETAQSLQLSAQALAAQAEAVAAYAQARKEAALDAIKSMEDIRKQQEEQAAQRAWEEQYKNAKDTSEDPNEVTKETMLKARIAANKKAADDAQTALTAAYAQADALAAQIARGEVVTDEQLAQVQAAQQAAETAAQQVTTAQDAIEADQATLDNLMQTIATNNSSGGSTTGGGNITPSRTALEDAALAVDRYTASVAQAEDAALSEQSVTQFVQNNYSPEALSASEIYRQTKNLTSVADVKMGV